MMAATSALSIDVNILVFSLCFVGGKDAAGRQHDGSHASRLVDPPRAAPGPEEAVLRDALDHHAVGLVAAESVEGLRILADIEAHVAVEAGGGPTPKDDDVAKRGFLLGNPEGQPSLMP